MPQTKLKALIASESEEIIKKQIQIALRGSPISAKLLLDKIIPSARSAPIESPVALNGSPAERAERILAALASAEITQDDAAALLQGVMIVQEISDAAELRKRLDDIEAKLDALTAGAATNPFADGGEDAPS
jgi:hypothetical protein